MPSGNHRSADVASLCDRDPVMATLVARFGLPPALRPVPAADRFGALARAICYQQLAGRSASSIHGRLVDALDADVTAERVLHTDPATLASCGLSASKVASLRDLAEHVVSGRVALGRIGRLSDEQVVAHLVQVRGIGRWTADMFLISTLGRPDVWPVGDFGVRVGYAAGWELPEVPTPLRLAELGDRYRPHRSTVAWYCWRVADGAAGQR
jgi:3-methyladenine DNA glycosylase/8-oxoguanine DNA glycosylase